MRKKQNYWISVVFLVALILMMTGCRTVQDEEKDTSDAEIDALETLQIETTTEEKIELPYELDDGRLIINSIFESTIANPDCNDEDGENIASIEVVNQSGEFLAFADITVKLGDDSALIFRVTDIPAGATVWAFETGNTEIDEDTICKSAECTAEYEAGIPIMDEQLAVEADGTTVIIRNLTDETLNGLEADFHCLFDQDLYYGGKTYTYPIDMIPAGESISLEVDECYLGAAQVVRITQEN